MAKKLSTPFIVIRGNHDSEPWARYAKQSVSEDVTEQLNNHSSSEHSRIFEWTPIIWKEIDHPSVYTSKKTAWHDFPLNVQDWIFKIRDATPAYYAFAAGDMIFICLDTSNWLLGETQMKWLEQQVASAEKPIVIIAHHHFLPVGVGLDTAQVHERDFLRQLVLNNQNIIAYLHAHAHFDQWWSYGNTDIIAVRDRACRSVTFESGRVIESILDGGQDKPKPFAPEYLCGQTFNPGKLAWMSTDGFSNPWGQPQTACLGWLEENAKDVDITWSMRLPVDVSKQDRELLFQIANSGNCHLEVTAPGLNSPIEKTIPPAPQGQRVTINPGPLVKGLFSVRLTCDQGWGYTAITAIW